MIVPTVTSRVKEWNQVACLGVDSTQIWALGKIASRAAQRKIVSHIRAAVLSSYNMLDMVKQFREFLLQPAVLAP
jgi:hypothetical protein